MVDFAPTHNNAELRRLMGSPTDLENLVPVCPHRSSSNPTGPTAD